MTNKANNTAPKELFDYSSIDPAIIATWKTDNKGGSDSNQIELPLVRGAPRISSISRRGKGGKKHRLNLDFNVDWGDGKSDHITTWDDEAKRHTYAIVGTYEVIITGNLPLELFDFSKCTNNDALKIIGFVSFGQWTEEICTDLKHLDMMSKIYYYNKHGKL